MASSSPFNVNLKRIIITICNSSCRKVIFSQACVKVGGGVHPQQTPPRQTPSCSDTPSRHPPLLRHPQPTQRWPLQQMSPTGMHSFFFMHNFISQSVFRNNVTSSMYDVQYYLQIFNRIHLIRRII